MEGSKLKQIDGNKEALSVVQTLRQRVEKTQVHTPVSVNFSRFHREFESIKLLGKGAFGSVVLAKHKLDGSEYAVKKIVFTGNGFQSDAHTRVLREVRALAKLDHPNVCRSCPFCLCLCLCPCPS